MTESAAVSERKATLTMAVQLGPDDHEKVDAAALRSALRPFVSERKAESWYHVISTLTMLGLLIAHAAIGPTLWWRLAGSLGAGLVIVRTFILYHDYQHGAILRKSKLGSAVMSVIGWLLLTPPNSWRRSHNYHHAHVGQREHANVGAFPTMSVDEYRQASRGERFGYIANRHPLTIMAAYMTVFFANVCVSPFLRDPRNHLDSIVAVIAHAGVIALALVLGGWTGLLLTVLIPVAVASLLGAYLFFAQHNAPGIDFFDGDDWDRTEAALASSSYLKTNPVMHWLTGNIGYHHVHHANHAIPFYRLPEAMAAVPALQPRCTTTLGLKAIFDVFNVSLWDTEKRQLVPLKAARKPAAA